MELAVNDCTIDWPPTDRLGELAQFASKNGQPFFLNHVTARRRCKDAFMRMGMALASFCTVWCLCHWMEDSTVASVGLTMDAPFLADAAVGLVVGVFIVAFIFVVEVQAGWVHVIGFFEVFDKTENFATCIFWDIIFHLNVALNEELPVRGWMLHNLADACAKQFNFSPIVSFVIAMVAQSLFFVAMHLASPGGAQTQSMINIFVGGISGGLNVLFTGGRLGFALGWHFGWNITMGNVFGLSTSGIPISGTFVAVAPHPKKEAMHGGVFGPEGGWVSPVAYLLGIVLLVLTYGAPESLAGIGEKAVGVRASLL